MIDRNAIRSVLKDYPFVAAAWLFGSRASGSQGPMSDADIAILLGRSAPTGRRLIHAEDEMAARLAKPLKVKDVDLVALNSQGLVFRHNVLRTGRLVYDADRRYRIAFTQRVIVNFCDFEPTLRLVEKHHLKGRLKRLKAS
ncbi:MAG: nucleotidyltransferase domain-containing protein [Deltaproteobacteria bacterium]|nr:nucleotidyltransferase domain-containing protein [Deltaproteobacteria bacterium]